MLNKQFISPFAIVCFLVSFTLSRLILGLLINYSRIAGTAGYILSIYLALLMTLIIVLISKLYKPFYGIDLFTVAKYSGGKLFSKIASGLYFIVFIIITTLFLREISEAMKILLFDTTPILIISLFFAVAMVLGSASGLEGIIRACGYVIPIAIVGIILTIIFSTPFWDFDRLYPLLGHGISHILLNGLPRITTFLGFIYLFDLINYVETEKELTKIAYIYVGISFVLISLCVLANTLTFAHPYIDSSFFALYELAKITNLNSLFLRSEIIYIFTLMIIAFIFIISMFYGTLNFMYKTINIKANIWLNIAVALVIFILSNIPNNLMEVYNYYNIINSSLLLPITFILPFVIMGIANIRRLKNRSKYEEFISNNN